MSSTNHVDHEPFYHYYAEASRTPQTLRRFRSIQECMLRVFAGTGGPARALDVADIGCGAGTQCLLWSERGHRVHGLDVNEPLLELAQKRAAQAGHVIDVRVGSAVKVPWPDQSMDIVLMAELLEHVAEWEPCLSECHRVLKIGGLLYLSTTNKLCPLQQEFKLPMYSWYPGWVKRRIERLAVTSHPHLVSHAEFPAVHWFSFYSLRAALSARGFECLDRFDVMDLSNKGSLARLIVSAIRAVPILRWCAHILTEGTMIVAVRKS